MSAYLKTAAPHIRAENHARRVFWLLAISLIPALCAGLFWYRWDMFRLAFTVLTFTGFAEWILSCAGKNKILFEDGSSVFYAFILIGLLPSGTPAWLAALAAVIGIGLGKEFSGGKGSVLFHPSLLGAAVLEIFSKNDFYKMPAKLTFFSPENFLDTPASILSWFLGMGPSGIGQVSAAALFAGVFLLAAKKVIRIENSLVYLFAAALGLIFTGRSWEQILTAPFLFTGFWVVTDPLSAPVSRAGKNYFAVLGGFLTAAFMFLGTETSAPIFAVLIMNAVSPWIDYILRPKKEAAYVA